MMLKSRLVSQTMLEQIKQYSINIIGKRVKTKLGTWKVKKCENLRSLLKIIKKTVTQY